jgi:hypothetical protein
MADLAAALAADEEEFGEFLDPVDIPGAAVQADAAAAAAYKFEEVEDVGVKAEEVASTEVQLSVKDELEEEEEAGGNDMDVIETEPYKAPQGPILMDEVALLPQHGKHKGTSLTATRAVPNLSCLARRSFKT